MLWSIPWYLGLPFESTSSFVPVIASGTAVTSCAKNPSTILESPLKLNLYGLSVFNLVIPSDIALVFSFNL